jgi:serine/threonine protein kinase
MPKVTADNFIELVGRSGLIEKEQIAAAKDEMMRRHAGRPIEDSQAVADYFIEAGLLTRWQADRLLEGRYKGFYLGKYKLLDHLGTGGMSMVYLAEQKYMHRHVAIKVLPQSRVNDEAYLTRFYHEARAAGQLAHQNIVHTYDIDTDGKTHYIVMEYVPGKNLQEIVKAEGPLGYRRAADYIAQAADGLAYAHEAGLVHRDVKPANLLVDERGVVKVLDLGLAYLRVEGQPSLTLASDDNVLGTADYCPPEQARNSHDVDGRADIYSLGCTLYFLLTGHPPFDEGSIAARLLAHQSQEPPSIYKERPMAPPELVEICQQMMAKRPEDRYQSMHEVSDVLHRWVVEGGDPGSSGRLSRFTDSPSGLLRRQSSSSARLRSPAEDSGRRLPESGVGRGSGSSVIGRELRPGSGSIQPGSGAGSKPPESRPREDSEELELAVLPDEKQAQAAVASKPGSSSAPRMPQDQSAAPGAGRAVPQRPVDFSTWLSEELSQPSIVAQSGEHRLHRHENDRGQWKFWLLIGAGALVTLLLAIGLIVLLG